MRDDDTHTEDQHRYHMAEITRILGRWRDGDLSTSQKRAAIVAENRAYYGQDAPVNLVRAGRRYELPAVLAEAAGIDEQMMLAALNARRHGGRQAFDDVLAAAGTRREGTP